MFRRIAGRAAACLAAVVTALSMSGCALSALTAENVMEPPQAYGDGAEIQAALVDALGPQITLRYPRSGEHRSAVVRADVDNDDHEEAIVFYRQATENAGAHMALLDVNEEGDWVLTGEFTGAEGEIDRVMFGDIDGNRTLDIITGWSVHSDYGVLYVHSCTGGVLSVISIPSGRTGADANSSYSEMTVGDFDRDSIDEILTVCLPGDENSGEARLLKWRDSTLPGGSDSIRIVSTVMLHTGTRSYIGCTAGYLNWNTWGVVVDSQRTDGKYSSELLLWNENEQKLVSPVLTDDIDMFSRTGSAVSEDINRDGYIEIPGDSLLPDCSGSGEENVYLTHWYRYNGSDCVRAFSAIMRIDYGYYFVMPEEWSGRVTARQDIETRSLHFYLADKVHPFSTELMCIRVFTTDEWEENPENYIELYTADYYVYAVEIMQPPSPVKVDYDTVTGCFVLMM